MEASVAWTRLHHHSAALCSLHDVFPFQHLTVDIDIDYPERQQGDYIAQVSNSFGHNESATSMMYFCKLLLVGMNCWRSKSPDLPMTWSYHKSCRSFPFIFKVYIFLINVCLSSIKILSNFMFVCVTWCVHTSCMLDVGGGGGGGG